MNPAAARELRSGAAERGSGRSGRGILENAAGDACRFREGILKQRVEGDGWLDDRGQRRP
jgi:hypothetical protein